MNVSTNNSGRKSGNEFRSKSTRRASNDTAAKKPEEPIKGKKIAGYVRKEIANHALKEAKEAERKQQEFEDSFYELSGHKFSKHTARSAAEKVHQRLNEVIDYFNEHAASYPKFADRIKRLKTTRAKYKYRLEHEPEEQEQRDEAA